jgi:hypothetical protein
VNGGGEFQAGGLVIVAATIDNDLEEELSLSGLTSPMQAYISPGGAEISFVGYWAILEEGDEASTTITLSWLQSQKACMDVYSFAPGAHDGLSGTPSQGGPTFSLTPSLPAITLDDGENLVFGHCGSDSTVTVIGNPGGYDTDSEGNASGSGNVSQWIGTDVLGGEQSSTQLIRSLGTECYTGIIAVKAAQAGGGGGGIITPRLRMGIGIGF